MFNSLVCGAIKSIRFPKPPRHAGNGRRARAPAAADDGFPARFFFFGVALPGGKVLVNWAGTTKQLEFYVIRHEFSEWLYIRQNNRIILGFKWFTRRPSKSFERIKSSPCPRISLSSISVMPFEQFHLVIKCGNGINYRGFNRKTNGNDQSIPVYHSHVSPATIWGCK